MAVPTTRRTQAERRQESSLKLLNAAIEVIATKGVAAATFENLGMASGLSRGLVTKRFGSRDRMIEAVLVHLHASRQRIIDNNHLEDLPGLDAVLAYADLSLQGVAASLETKAYFRLLSAAVADMNCHRTISAALHEEVRQLLARWVAKGQAEGAIRTDLEAGTAALMVGCLILGVSMQVKVDPGRDIEPVRQTGVGMIRDYLSGPAPAQLANVGQPARSP
jgi:AcrR family transcriptional regulator